MAKRAMPSASRFAHTCCSWTSCVLQKGHHSALRWKTTSALRSPRVACRSCTAPLWSGRRTSGKGSPSRGPIVANSLGRRGIRCFFLYRQRLVAGLERGRPGDLYGVLDALMRGTALRMRHQGALSCLPRVCGNGELVVHVDGLDVNGLADARDAAFHGGSEGVAVKCDFAPCQGAAQGAVHSPGDGGHDVVESGRDGWPLGDPVVLAQAALHAVDHGGGDVAEIRVTIAVPVLKTRARDVLEWIRHEGSPWCGWPPRGCRLAAKAESLEAARRAWRLLQRCRRRGSRCRARRAGRSA